MFRIVYWLAKLVLYPIYRFSFVGRGNIPKGACLICGNHTGLIDPVLLVLALESKGNYSVMGKAELFTNKLFAAVLRFVRVFPVRREESDVMAVKTALKTLKDGKRLIIFPEGTRVKEGESAEIKSGAGMFAIRGNVPVVPVYLPAGKKAWRRNIIRFGVPIDPPKLEGRKATPEDYTRHSLEIMQRINALAPEQISRG